MRISLGLRRSLAAVAFGLLSAAAATAQTVTGLYNTGVDNLSNPLPDNALDPHWFFVFGLSPHPTAGPNATVSCTNSAWHFPGANAKWIAPNTNGCGSMPLGSYTFFTHFTLSGFDLSTVSLTGSWSSDNTGFGVFLNGVQIAPSTYSTAFNALHPFSAGPTGPGAPIFVNGMNTLAVQFQNEGGPGGVLVRELRVVGQAQSNVVPEPMSMLLLGTGLAGVAGAARRRPRADHAV